MQRAIRKFWTVRDNARLQHLRAVEDHGREFQERSPHCSALLHVTVIFLSMPYCEVSIGRWRAAWFKWIKAITEECFNPGPGGAWHWADVQLQPCAPAR